MHTLDRLNERYGNKFRYADITKIKKNLRRNLYFELADDFINRDRIVVLTYYNELPLKLVYNKKTKNIVTALPLDVDEFNKFSELIPKASISNKTNDRNDIDSINKNFQIEKSNKELNKNLEIEEEILNNRTLYARKYTNGYILLWCKTSNINISYQIFKKSILKKSLWDITIESFKENNTKLLFNTTKLYLKLFK